MTDKKSMKTEGAEESRDLVPKTTLPSKARREKDQTLALPDEDRVRAELAIATTRIKGVVSQFAEYTDPSGKKSTGAKGFAVQISGRIKSEFGAGYDDLDLPGQVAVTGLLLRIEDMVYRGMAQGRSRDDIKQASYLMIKRSGQAYQADREVFTSE